MDLRLCKKCKNKFFVEYSHCPTCGQEYRENNLPMFCGLAAVAVLLISALVYQYMSSDLKSAENPEPEAIQKEDAARLEEMISKLPDARKLEEEKVRIEERISQLSKKLSMMKYQHKRTINLDGVMGHMTGEIQQTQDTAVEELIAELPEAKQLKEEEARLATVMNQLAEISRLNNKLLSSEERMKSFSEARRLFINNLDAANEELVVIKGALESFKSKEDEYLEAQKLLVFINEKIALKSKKIKRKNQAVENERFEAETASLDDKGKRLKREHPGWTTEECDLISKGKIKTGMIEEQVRAALGEPFSIKANSARSKWILRENSTACVYFEGGVCVAIQQ